MKVNIYLQMLQEFFNCFLSMIKLLIELKEFMQSKSAGHIFRISENRNGFLILQMLQEFFNCFLSMIKLLIELKEFMQSKSAGHIFRISENRNGFLILLILKGEFYRALKLKGTADREINVFNLKRAFG